MNELIALLDRYSPGYRDNIKGYPDFLLDEVEEAFGRPLPAFYREFAQAMGEDGGRLLSAVRSYDPLLSVAELYRLTPKRELPPGRFLFVFGDPDPLAPHHYWLDLEAPSEDGDCEVVRIPLAPDAWKAKLSRAYISLRELLFLWAMEYIHLPGFPHQARYHRGKGRQTATAEDLAQLLEKMGFTRLPYPRHSMLFERDDAAVRLYRPPHSSYFEIRVGLRGPEMLRHVQALFEDKTDLERSIG